MSYQWIIISTSINKAKKINNEMLLKFIEQCFVKKDNLYPY